MSSTKNPWLVDATVRVIGSVGNPDTGLKGTIVAVELGSRKGPNLPYYRNVTVLLRDSRTVVFRSDQLEVL